MNSNLVASAPKLRLLRSNELVLVFLNDTLVFERTWTSVDAYLEFGVMGDTVTGSMISVALSNYIRRPVIMFGDVPMTEFRFMGSGRVDGIVPASDAVGPVTVHVEDFDSEYDLNEPFIYESAVEFRSVGTDVNGTLVVVTDGAVRA